MKSNQEILTRNIIEEVKQLDNILKRLEKINEEEEKRKKGKITAVTSLVQTKEEIELLESAIKNTGKFKNTNITDLNFELIYSTNRDTWSCDGFHRNCDGKNDNLVIIKTTENRIFGGFTTLAWDLDEETHRKYDDNNAFVFSFVTMKFYPIINGKYAIYTHREVPWFDNNSEEGIIFFGNNSLTIGHTQTANISHYQNFEEDYEINGGNYTFVASQIDVLQISKQENI